MEPLLYLVHRIPFPPNKGDKIRSYHLLRHLAERYAVHLGTFVDSAEDLAHVAAAATSLCASVHVETLDPRAARLRSVSGFLTGEALTLPYYRNAALQSWVTRIVAQQRIRKAVVFSAAMAQYVSRSAGLRVVLDFVDVDSAKWCEYAAAARLAFVVRLSARGREAAGVRTECRERSAASVFVTRPRRELFARLAPGFEGRLHVVENGVNTDYFAPHAERASPYAENEAPIVFTGAMDYWPNIDAVTWFTSEVLPSILAARPDARFYIVGMNPAPAVTALGLRSGVVVTGTVPDVRPYVQHAAVVVAPLRVARGIQNKILEAMAMGRAVVVSTATSRGISGVAGDDFEMAESAEEFADKVLALLEPGSGARVGQAARARIVADYSWDRNLAAFDRLLEGERRSVASGVAK